MVLEKSISPFWLYKILPNKIVSFLILIRFEKPTGFLLLMWPCWFALAIFSIKSIQYYILFFLGSFFMRSAGCIINDYFDRKIDKNVKRTASRPLASGDLRIIEAIIFMFILLLFSFFILLQFKLLSIIIALISMPLIIVYPFMKRYTYWPQLVLGITFNWGILIVSAEYIGGISFQAFLLYIACIFWTLGYDTIYAYQDKEDDIKSKLRSTAILFGKRGKIIVMFFYCSFVFFIFAAQNFTNFKFSNLIIILTLLLALLALVNKWDIYSHKSSNYYFKLNNLIGLIFFLYLTLTN